MGLAGQASESAKKPPLHRVGGVRPRPLGPAQLGPAQVSDGVASWSSECSAQEGVG